MFERSLHVVERGRRGEEDQRVDVNDYGEDNAPRREDVDWTLVESEPRL